MTNCKNTLSVCLWKQIPSGCPQWFLYCSAHHDCTNNTSSVAFCCSSSFWKPDPHSSAFFLLSSSLPDMTWRNTCSSLWEALCSGGPQVLDFTFTHCPCSGVLCGSSVKVELSPCDFMEVYQGDEEIYTEQVPSKSGYSMMFWVCVFVFMLFRYFVLDGEKLSGK